jgi:hypothetical protein
MIRLILIVALACMALAGCGQSSRRVNGVVINRVQSPNGAIDAIITRSEGGGATVPYYYRIYLESNKNGSNYKILEANYPHGISLKWTDSNRLLIDMPCASIFSYTNFF